MSRDRKTELLEAALDFLKTIETSPHSNALNVDITYDGTDCDGHCLMDDIETFLELDLDWA